jgi:predicted alpha/beta-fold hydrolase
MFLRTMRSKALLKLVQHPGLFERHSLLQARTLYDFDNVFTAPVHGFVETQDYWRRASAKPGLVDVAVPSLLLNAINDPFVPHESLPTLSEVSKWVSLWQPEQGGHVGFPSALGGRPWAFHIDAMPTAVVTWLKSHLPHEQPL